MGELLTVNHGDGRKETMRVINKDKKFPFILMHPQNGENEYEQIHVRSVMADRADPGNLAEGLVPEPLEVRSAALSKCIHDRTMKCIRMYPTKLDGFNRDLENGKFFGAISGTTDRFNFIDVFSPNMPRVFKDQLIRHYGA